MQQWTCPPSSQVVSQSVGGWHMGLAFRHLCCPPVSGERASLFSSSRPAASSFEPKPKTPPAVAQLCIGSFANEVTYGRKKTAESFCKVIKEAEDVSL